MIPNLPGIYSLVVWLSKETTLRVGALGIQTLPSGYYVYTGSALGPGGLKSRIEYHVKKNKSRSGSVWHIDILLAHKSTTMIEVVTLHTMKQFECDMNQYIKERMGMEIPIIGFGASDCTKKCKSHLLFFPDILKESALVQKVKDAYSHFVEGS